jgi:phosphoglycerate dehydrogenase-like enzyme
MKKFIKHPALPWLLVVLLVLLLIIKSVTSTSRPVTPPVDNRIDSLSHIVDSLNKSYAAQKGIKLFRTPDAFTQPVADTTLAYILGFCRGVQENTQILKNGGWDKPQGFSLFEKNVGIVGFGNIGQAVARRLKAFGTSILAYDIQGISPSLELEYGVQSVTLDMIFSECDFITLHCDLNATSQHLLKAESFEKMRKKPFIINTSRGPVINENDLIEALHNNQIAGAGLDVFEVEPLPTTSPLRNFYNVFLASHNSNSSPSCWNRVHQNSVSMLLKGLGIKI